MKQTNSLSTDMLLQLLMWSQCWTWHGKVKCRPLVFVWMNNPLCMMGSWVSRQWLGTCMLWAEQCMAWSVSRSPAQLWWCRPRRTGVWSQLHHGRGGQRPSVSRQSRRGRGAVRGHALFKLVLQTIHRFSQSQRRPLLLLMALSHLRHCAKWVVTHGK